MKAQFEHNLMSSFYLWFDNKLKKEGEAIITGRTQFFTYGEGIDTPSNMNAFYSSANQFCVDDTGSPSGIMSGGTMIYQNATGAEKVLIDTNRGRILMNTGYGTGIEISGNFIQKEINLYTTNETDEEIIMRGEFYLESGQSYSESMDQLAKAKYYAPCVFLSNNDSENKGFAMGGVRDTSSRIKAVVFARSVYQLDAILDIFRDSAEECVKIIDMKNFPYGEYWHLKSYPYDYSTFVNQNKIDYTFIKKVRSYKIKDRGENAARKIAKGLFLGYIDFELSTIR